MLAAAPSMNQVYDFSVIETAIETLAEAAPNAPTWLTGFDAAQFQKARPRVECYLEQGTPFGDPPHYVNTAIDGQRRVNGWRGTLKTTVITEGISGLTEAETAKSSYAFHNTYRSFLLNLLATIDQQLRDNPTLLPFHQIARCWEIQNIPTIHANEGYYKSQLAHSIIYSVRPSAWPGGLLDAGQIPT